MEREQPPDLIVPLDLGGGTITKWRLQEARIL